MNIGGKITVCLGIVLLSFYYCLINDYCLIIDRRTQVLFFIFLLTLTSDRRGLSIFALKMTPCRDRQYKIEKIFPKLSYFTDKIFQLDISKHTKSI